MKPVSHNLVLLLTSIIRLTVMLSPVRLSYPLLTSSRNEDRLISFNPIFRFIWGMSISQIPAQSQERSRNNQIFLCSGLKSKNQELSNKVVSQNLRSEEHTSEL